MPRVFKAGYALAGPQESSEDEEGAAPAAGHEPPPEPPPYSRCSAAAGRALFVFAIVVLVLTALVVPAVFALARHQPMIDRAAGTLSGLLRGFLQGPENPELPGLGSGPPGSMDAPWELFASGAEGAEGAAAEGAASFDANGTRLGEPRES